MSQQQIVSQVAQAALPLAFQEYGQERARQLGLSLIHISEPTRPY